MDSVETICLVPEGSNPHLFEPTPRQVQGVYEAKVWISLGEAFEKITSTLSSNHKDLKIVDLSKLVPLDHSARSCSCAHHHSHESQDLHIWLSPKLAQKQALAIEQALSQAFPDQSDVFKNLDTFLTELSVKLTVK
jgi:ABC-type Zn uptake system ZnuABC Zn-binding protein ZnuA